MQPTISIYIGHTLSGSEAAYLQQLVLDLERHGTDAVVLASFEVIGNSGSRQVDLFVVTPTRAQLHEEKELHGPIQGGVNGQWKLQDRSGHWIPLDRPENPFAQVVATKNAINDAMEKFQRKSNGSIPEALSGKFYYQFDTLVVVWPLLDPASKIEGNSQKARVLGYTDAMQSLIGTVLKSSWGLKDWMAFAEYLRLSPVTLREAIDASVFEAKKRLEQYRLRFSQCFSPHLPSLIEISGDSTIGKGLVNRLNSDRHVLLVGSSGSTKSFHMSHAALAVAVRGDIPLFVRPIGRWADFKHVLHNAVAAYTKSSVEGFLRDVKASNQALHVFVDGLNEFGAAPAALVLEGLLWLQSSYGARIILSTTHASELPPPLLGDSIPLGDLTPVHKAAIFAHYCGQRGPVIDGFLAPFQNAYDIVVAAQGTGGDVGIGLAERYDRFVRQRLSPLNQAASLVVLRELANYMAEEAYSAMPLDDFDRFAEGQLAKLAAPIAVVDNLKASGLLSVTNNAIGFQHERLLRYFQGEALRRRNATVGGLVLELQRPACRDVRGFVLERLVGADLRQALEHIHDSSLLVEIAHGLWGATAKSAVETSLRRVLTDIAAELPNISIRWEQATYENGHSAVYPKTLVTTRPWTKFEHQLLRLAGNEFGNSAWDGEILAILQQANDHFMSLVAKAAVEATPKLPRLYLVSEFLRVMVGLHHGNDDDPFTSLLAGVQVKGLSYVRSRVKAFYDSLAVFTNGDTSNVILLLLMLDALHLVDPDVRDPAACLRLIAAGWNSKVNFVRISALQLTESCAILRRSDDCAFAEQLDDLVGQMETNDLLLSSRLNEVRANLGVIEIGLTVEDALADFRRVMSLTPAEVKSFCEATGEVGYPRTPEQYIAEGAMAAVSKVFEDVFQGVYYEAYEQLSDVERVELLCRAALAEDGFFTDWVIAELIKLNSFRALPVLAARSSAVRLDSIFRQDSIGAYFIALAGHAKLSREEPAWAMPRSPINDAWRLVGLIWWIQFSESPQKHDESLGYWATLIAEMPFQALQVLSALQTDHHTRMNDVTKGVSLLSRYPEQFCQLFEHALVNRASLPADIGGIGTYGVSFVIQGLAQVGSKAAIELLRPLNNDPEVGKAALDAIAEIRRRSSN